MRALLSLYIIILVSGSLYGQVTDLSLADTTLLNTNGLSPQNKDVVVKRVNIWKNRTPIFSDTVTTDSLLRWNIFPNWGDYYAYRNDVISYRQGTIGRTDAYTISGFDQYEQNLWLDDISLNNPVTGLINYNYVPDRKIGKVYESYGSNLNSYVNIRDYYINEPISYLNFDEAPNGYQNLEFFVAQNTAPGTNIEISYWDRSDEGFYPNNGADGSQILGRVYHHLGKEYLIKGLFLRNDFSNDESNGYVIGDPLAFSFAEFASTPLSLSGKSEILRTDMKIGVYQRSDTLSAESAGLIFHRTKNDESTRINADTLNWELINYGARVFKNFKSDLFTFQSNVSTDLYSMKSGSTIGLDSWFMARGEGNLEYKITDNLRLVGNGGFITRDTKHFGSSLSSGLSIGNNNKFNTKFIVGLDSKIPTIQSLYWESKSFSGNTDLKNETSTSAYGEINMPLSENWTVGVSGRLKWSNDAVTFYDSTFVNSRSQEMTFGSGYVRFESPRLELESSTAYEQYYLAPNSESNSNEPLINFKDSRLWIRNSLFYKTYAFERATFLKMGVRTVFSPLNYQSQFYNAELSYWQQNFSTNNGRAVSYVPAFFRLDAELSARVRAMMIVIRWENALDGLGQAGYFEASSYPMPPRRLMVGIRAQFRN